MKNRLDNQKNMLYKLLCSIEKLNAQVAQSVEQRTENPRVSGSIPEQGTFYGALAQSVEHLTFNQVVRGSNPRCFTFFIYICRCGSIGRAADL